MNTHVKTYNTQNFTVLSISYEKANAEIRGKFAFFDENIKSFVNEIHDKKLGDAFIAFPGGTGTLEEIAEVMSKVSLGQLDAPCILYDLNGYYDSLKALLAKMIEKGLSTPQRQQGIRFAANLEEITTILNKA